MFKSDVDKLLRFLMTVKRYKPPIHRSIFAEKFDSGSRWVMYAAAALFLAMLALAGLVYFEANNSEGVKLAGRVVGTLSMLLVLISLVLTTVSSVITMARAKSDFFEDFLEQKNYDMVKAAIVLSVADSAVLYSQKVLQLKLSRIDRKLNGLFGSSDKIALFSLAGMGWGVYKEVGQQGIMFGDVPTAVSWVLVFVLAFLFGASLGALVVKNIADQCHYALEIIDLGLFLKARA